MFFKTLLLAILAYYVVRAAGNLIRAVSGDEGIPDSAGEKSTTGRRANEREEDIEDARFRDL